LKFDDKFLNEILKKFHGQLYSIIKNKKRYFCTALMLYLEKDEHNIYHAYLLLRQPDIACKIKIFQKLNFKILRLNKHVNY